MEGLDQKLDRISNDVTKIIDLYDYAEKLLPYETIREPIKVIFQDVLITNAYDYSWTKMTKERTLHNWLLMAMEQTICKELASGV